MEKVSWEISSADKVVQWSWESLKIFGIDSEEEDKWDDSDADGFIAVEAVTEDNIFAGVWKIAAGSREEL